MNRRPINYPRLILLAFILTLASTLTACDLILGEPQTITIPTPGPTAPSIEAQFQGTPVQDPVSNIVAAVDPSIASLLDGPNGVSRQNLEAYVRTLENFGTRHSNSDTQSDTVGIGAARRWIFSEFERVGAGRLQVRFDDFSHTTNGITTNQRNVIATLPGSSTHPGLIVLTAHYDSRSGDPFDSSVRAPGANDNATGIALLIEAARVMSSRSWNQTIVFVAFAAEEQGTVGSRHYVTNSLLDGVQIDAALNFDIIGGREGIPQSVRAFALGPDTSGNQQLVRYVDFVGAFYVPQFPIRIIDGLDRPDRYGDQREFINVGIPAIRFTESEEDPETQHTGFDTAERLDYDYLQQVTQLMISAIANMAGAPIRPQPPLIAAMADPGTFILNWQPAPDAAGYALSFRPVGSPTYPPLRYVRRAESGNVVLTGFDPTITYAVSMAALDVNGRIGMFSPEVIIVP